MDNLSITVMLGMFVTLVPYIMYNFNSIRVDKNKTILWGIISFILSLLVFKITGTIFNYIGLITTIIVATMFNLFIVKKDVDIKKIPKSILVILLFFFISLVQLIPIYLFNLDINNLTTMQTLLLTLFSNSILLVILISMYRDTLKDDFKKIKNNFNEMMDTGIKCWLVGLIIMIISNVIIGLFIPLANAGNEQGVQEYISTSGIVSMLAIGIIAPIIEELTFRKAFRDIFKSKWLFILSSGLIFGSLHVVLSLNSLWDLFYIIPYSSLGIAFGYMYYKTDNIYTSIIMHMFHNTSLTILSIIGGVMVIL